MGLSFQTAKMLAETIKREHNGKVSRLQLCKMLREVTNCMDSRWIKKFAISMTTADLLRETSEGIFEVVEE